MYCTYIHMYMHMCNTYRTNIMYTVTYMCNTALLWLLLLRLCSGITVYVGKHLVTMYICIVCMYVRWLSLCLGFLCVYCYTEPANGSTEYITTRPSSNAPNHFGVGPTRSPLHVSRSRVKSRVPNWETYRYVCTYSYNLCVAVLGADFGRWWVPKFGTPKHPPKYLRSGANVPLESRRYLHRTLWEARS